MGKRYYLVSAAAIATMAALAIPASAQPFSETMGSWGYGGYGAFRTVLWVLILIAFIFGITWRVWTKKTDRPRAVPAPSTNSKRNEILERAGCASCHQRARNEANLKLPRCPLLAQSRHEQVHCTCPLSGVERKVGSY